MRTFGEFFRSRARLQRRFAELAILVAARNSGSRHVWEAHAPKALAAGLPQATLDRLAIPLRLEGTDPEIAAIHQFCMELHHDRRASDASFESVRAVLNLEQTAELTAIYCFYELVATLANVADPGQVSVE